MPKMIETRYEHIALDEAQTPMIAGTTMKVIELVLNHLSHGWSAAELHFQHPDLTMGQIHSALAYYHDHQPEMDAEIERRLQTVDALASSTTVPPLVLRLRQQRKRL